MRVPEDFPYLGNIGMRHHDLMKRVSIGVLIFLILFSACRKRPEKELNPILPKIVKAEGRVISLDSVARPVVVNAGTPRTAKAGKPEIKLTNVNVTVAGNPKVVLVSGIVPDATRGQDTFLFPEMTPVVDSAYIAGIPEVVLAKDAYIKDINPQNFSSFRKLQGLKHSISRCMMQDKNLNIWIGTDNGASCYDGKYFRHLKVEE